MQEPDTCEVMADYLRSPSWEDRAEDLVAMAKHICACPCCRHGRARLPEHITLTAFEIAHERCLLLFPTFYEATRPDYQLTGMEERELVAVVLHLAACSVCREQYDLLCLVWELEERYE